MISRLCGAIEPVSRISHEPAIIRDPRGFQPVAAVRRRRPVRDRPAAGGGGRGQWRRVGATATCPPSASNGARPRCRERGRVANENTPKLHTFDPKGYRRDVVEFHPAYHELMARSAHAGVHDSTWTRHGKPAGGAAEVVRAAKFYMAAQVESGHLCPITMTRASVAALAEQPDLLAKVLPVLGDARLRPGLRAVVEKARHDARHGHDREAGRHRRARQHDAGGAPTATPIASPATNGSCRRRCATPSWCWRRRRRG